MLHDKNRVFLVVAAAGLAVTSIPRAPAQSGALEEITVTARRKEENLQDVGISVSALEQTAIERQFVRDLKDLANMAPNLIIDDTNQGPGGVAAIYIRGIGVADVEKNFDPAVGVMVDNLFLGANGGAILRGIDLARVEVLRGPQGTLFGRNTVGGTINTERTRPSGALGIRTRVGRKLRHLLRGCHCQHGHHRELRGQVDPRQARSARGFLQEYARWRRPGPDRLPTAWPRRWWPMPIWVTTRISSRP